MKAICVICGELLEANAGICAVTCGHTFHGHCLLQWLERAKTCPQCRKRASDKNMIRLYFDAPPSEPSQLDALDLQSQLDNHKFQICLKDQEIKNLKDDNFLKKNQVEGLREECKKLEEILSERKKTISDLHAQVECLNHSAQAANQAKKEAKSALAKLKTLEVLQNLIEESSDDIEETLSSYSASNNHESIHGMATFICILKKEMKRLNNEKKKFREDFEHQKSRVKELKKEIMSNTIEIESLKKANHLLHEDSQALEKEIRSKEKKISSLESAIQSPSGDPVKSAITRLIRESPAPLELKKSENASSHPDFVDLTPEITRKTPRLSQESTIDLGFLPDKPSPHLQLKSSSSVNSSLKRSSFSLPQTKRSFQMDGRRSTFHPQGFMKSSSKILPPNEETGYDGLGGHSKPDIFPQPIRLPKGKNSASTAASRREAEAKKTIKVVSRRMQNGPRLTSASKFFFKNTFDD